MAGKGLRVIGVARAATRCIARKLIFVFVVGWIGQFYGHKMEGKKPSFLTDLQFLLETRQNVSNYRQSVNGCQPIG